ncbi:hypothetical protein EJ02DRAFT_188644 [Clathrospora elynae]|uniref:Uncharacterized protein n=1 Tax=Clathrospora elynae TaxID=706981 RepID=A0A6A5SQF7_9PLEO|nr:hypothetical protein EJ02DRAFT_188644 [Clathrospora elynae]
MAEPAIPTFEQLDARTECRAPVARHDSSLEPKISHPWWDLDKDVILQLLGDIAAKVKACLRNTICSDKEAHHGLNEAMMLARIALTNKLQIASIGFNGSGKSSHSCHTPDVTNLSTTGTKSESCNGFVVKFIYGAGSIYSASVKFLNGKALEALVAENTRYYREFLEELGDSEDARSPSKSKDRGQEERYGNRVLRPSFRYTCFFL